jgi:cysteine desulfurase/selenocysteine lyase
MDHYQVPATVRISFAIYNTYEEIDRFIDALTRVIALFK